MLVLWKYLRNNKTEDKKRNNDKNHIERVHLESIVRIKKIMENKGRQLDLFHINQIKKEINKIWKRIEEEELGEDEGNGWEEGNKIKGCLQK